MLSKTLEGALNQQINAEFYSAFIYLSMSTYFESANLEGFAHWMRVQYQEELGHGLKLVDFVNDRTGRVALEAIAKPLVDFKSPLDVMEQTLKHEQEVTASINRLYELAIKENDYPAQVMLQWFINEQVEEEKTADSILQQLKIIGADGTGLLMLDNRIGSRQAAPEIGSGEANG